MIQTRWGHLNRAIPCSPACRRCFSTGTCCSNKPRAAAAVAFSISTEPPDSGGVPASRKLGGWQHDTLTRGSRPELSRAAGRLEIRFSSRCGHAGGVAGGHERLQVPAASLDQGLDPDVQETIAHHLASQLPLPIKLEATGAFDVQFRLFAPAFLCVLLHPSTGGPQAGWVRTLLIDVPIFLTASVSVAVFYICAQRELYPRTWMKEMLLLPCLLAFGVGLSLNNARAVLEAVFNHQIRFHAHAEIRDRTQSRSPGATAATCRSSQLLPLLELAFAIYFSYFVVYAIAHRQFFSVPFLLMFQGGFLYVLPLFIRQPLVKSQFGQLTRKRCDSRLTRPELSGKSCACFGHWL